MALGVATPGRFQDASKFGRRSLSMIGDIRQVHRVISDRRVQEDVAVSLRERGIEVIIV
jgi:DeoR/GlpR family transcriptional regulator of sugar metabolism